MLSYFQIDNMLRQKRIMVMFFNIFKFSKLSCKLKTVLCTERFS